MEQNVLKKDSRTILLVEDEAVIAMAEAQQLRNRGYTVHNVYSGEEAIKTVDGNPDIDLILMDLDLGKNRMDGTAAAEGILARHDLPVVFLSSHTEPKIVEKTEKITSYGYIVKNTGFTVLDASIKMALKLFEANQDVKKHKKEAEEAYWEMERREERLQYVHRILLSIRNINQIITKESDRETLLQKACRILLETNGYDSASIILMDNGIPSESFYYGESDAYASIIKERILSGKIPPCVEEALEKGSVVIMDSRGIQCPECSVREALCEQGFGDAGSTGMVTRLKYAGRVYGCILVTLPSHLSGDSDEHGLFSEIAAELSYALHKMDVLDEKTHYSVMLREKDVFLKSVFESIQDGISVLDTDLTIRYTNGIMRQWYADRGDLTGQKCYSCYQNRNTPCVPCPSLRCIESGLTERDEVPGIPGSPVEYIELFSYPIKDPATGTVTGIVEFVRDITYRKKNELLLHESNEHLRATLNSIGDAVFSTDTQGHIIAMNPVAEGLTGWTFREAEGKPYDDVFRIINAQTREPADDPIGRVMKTNTIVGLANHTVLLARDGKEFQIADSASPVRDSSGRVTGVVVVFRDVTEAYRIREELKRNEDRLSKVLLAAQDGTWDWDLQTDKVHFDPRYFEMAGYERDEFPHRFEEFQKRVHPEDADRVLEEASQHLSGKIDQFNVEFRFQRKSGDWMWIQSRGKIVEWNGDGRPSRFIGTHTDISERKATEVILETERRRLKDVLEGTNVGMWEWNVETNELVVNGRWAEIIGYTLEELAPVFFATRERYTHPEDLEKSNTLLKEHMRGDTPFYCCDVRMRHKNGSWVWVLDRGRISVRGKDGKPVLVSGTHLDITDRKLAETSLKNALKEKENLLKELQHRVKNNFSMIVGMIRLKKDSLESEQLQDVLIDLESRINTFSELYTLLYQEDNLSEINLETYFRGLIDSMSSLSERIGITMELKPITVPLKEAGTLGMIMTELMTNALKHSFPDNAAGTITLALEGERKHGILTVENDGRPFPGGFDLEASAGLGLKMIKAMAETVGGDLFLPPAGSNKVAVSFSV